jgi:hypothetical protein
MYTLDKGQRVASIFVEVCAKVLEGGLVQRDSRGNRRGVYKDIAIFDYLIQFSHVHALVISME